ncbi:MAG: hypothetical protein K2Q26_04405 [Bdellovibrionales bacterium]|nr:hypothetical protein [Bdellovibrionales bacterium]
MSEKLGFWVVFIVYLFISSVGSTAHALQCTEIFEKVIDPLEQLTQIEAELQQDLDATAGPSRTQFQESVFRLMEQMEELFVGMATTPATLLHLQLQELKRQTRLMSQKIFSRPAETETRTIEDIRADTFLASPETPYLILGKDPVFKRVILSAEVVDSLFHSDIPQHRRAAAQILHSIMLGRVGLKMNGITSILSSENIFKVRIHGSGAVGAIRAAGYLRGNDFHLVTWTDERNHDQLQIDRLIRAVQRRRSERGH